MTSPAAPRAAASGPRAEMAIRGGAALVRVCPHEGLGRLAEPSHEPRVAERLFLNVGYSDQCNHLHENFYDVRNGVLETIWPILGRGKLQ